MPRRPWIRLSRGRVLLVLSLLGAAGLAAPQAWAWYHVRAARAALDRYHPEEARASLSAALTVWPERTPVRLLASRAARQAGDLEAADADLRAGQRLAGGASEDVAFEWALLQAAAGNVGEVDEYLQRWVRRDPPRAPLVWEALVTGYVRIYRTLDAMACANHWLERDPDNVRALELRGQTYVAGKGVQRGAEDFRRALELDPARDDTRWRLVLCLLDLGGYEEALAHLERVARRRPGDPEVVARIARCKNMLGRGTEARQELDALLERHPGHGLALRTRGHFALADQDPAAAERWLRRAADARPADYQTQWLLFQALRQQNKTAEAEAQLAVAERAKDDAERLGELQSRRIAEHPLDPALHYEMAVLLTRTGHPDVAERWLVSALALDPDHKPSHAALADYYTRTGDTAKAAGHRRQAGK